MTGPRWCTRRRFLRNTGLAAASLALPAAGSSLAAGAAADPSRRRPEVAAIYFPSWHPAVLVNAWNEWTEGSYLLPEEKHGTAYLEALKAAFARGGPAPGLK
jgi:hypothetical protein